MFGDIVARSVELGYRVVDEYLQQGQRAAERLGDRAYRPNVLRDDVQEVGMRMMQYASDFAGLWLEFMQMAAAGRSGLGAGTPRDRPDATAPRGQGPGPWGSAGESPEREATRTDGTRVRIEVVSPWPTEVSLDLRPDAARRRLVVHALRTVDPNKPRIDEVSFRGGSEKEPAIVRVRVPADQPAGIYSGLLIDEESSTPAGMLSVRVNREPPSGP